MKIVNIKDRFDNIVSPNNLKTEEELESWIEHCKEHNVFGRNERWVRAKVVDEVLGEVIYPDEKYEDADVLEEDVRANQETEIGVNYVKLRADYTIEVSDYKRVPKEVTMRQARVALVRAGIYNTVETAIANSGNQELQIDWEYSQVVRRDWESLNALVQSLGMTSSDVDDLFILAETL